jgi:hypothetical protein
MLLQSELYALATRQAIREGVKGVALRNRIAEIVSDPTPEMVSKASDFARYATFNSSPGKFTQKVIGLREAEFFGSSFKPLRFVVPFVSTPTNIFKIGVEYSPLGLVKLAKTGTSAESSDVIAKAIIGSLAMSGFAGLAASGKLTGAAPADPAQRSAFYRAGKTPFSVKVGNRWVQYNSLVGPLQLTLAATAAFWDAFHQRGEVPTSTKIAQAGAVIGQSITDATFFRGIENVINALTNPDRDAEKFFADAAGGLVPFSGLQRNIANSIDPEIKDAQGIYERILSGIPIASRTIPPKLDALGRPQTMEGGSGLLAFMPSRLPEDKPKSAVDAELNRLEIFPGKASGSLTLGNKKIALTREQKTELQRLEGQVMYHSLAALFDSPEYGQLSDEQKQQAANDLIARARKAGRDAFIGSNADKLKLK